MTAAIVPLDYGMPWEFNDGGRSDWYRGRAGDCVVRAIAIATGREYKTVYNDIGDMMRAKSKRGRSGRVKNFSPRNGVPRPIIRAYLDPDFLWTPTMFIGSGCTVHLRTGELPARGALIVSLSKHLTAVLDGIVHDTHDPSRQGTRCVYGYWTTSD